MAVNRAIRLRAGEQADPQLAEQVAWDGDKLVATDPAAVQKAAKRWLSHSTATRVTGCPAKHLAESILPRSEDPLSPGSLGVDAHTVLERLYELPKRQRTKKQARELIEQEFEQRWGSNPAASEHDHRQWREFVNKAVMGIWELEDPKTIDVAAVELHFKGTELPNGIAMAGFIDRVDRAPDGTLQIRDYKTGKYRKHNPAFGPNEKHIQLRNYTACVEKELGEKVSDAKLLFTVDHVVDPVALKPAHMKRTLEFYANAREVLDTATETSVYPANPSGLCGWCPLARTCPVGQVESEKAVKHANTTWPVFSIPQITNNGSRRAAANTTDRGSRQSHETEEDTMPTKTKSKPKPVIPAPELENYEAIGALATHHFAVSYVFTRKEQLLFQSPGEMITTADAFAKSVAALILSVQERMVGEADWASKFNGRVRSTVYLLIEQFPPPIGSGTTEDLQQYFTRAEAQAVFLLSKGIELLKEATPAQPDLEALASS